MLKQFAFTSLSVILVIQLVTLQPSFFWLREHSYGSLVSVAEDTKSYAQNIYTEATLSAVWNQNPYNAIIFTGDVMLGRHVETLLARHGSLYPYSGLSLKALAERPAIVGNFESAVLLPHRQTPANTLRFSVSEQHVAAFGTEFTHASLANNHSFDYGEDGYLNAVEMLEANAVESFGHGQKLAKDSLSYLETVRGRIALIGINATSQIPEQSDIDSACISAKRKSDFQIVYIHWGDEYESVHNDTQRMVAEMLVTACADLIVGHHPHVVQDVDVIKGVPVFYSLGNYIFDQYFSDEVKEGLVVALRLDSDVPALELVPISSHATQSVPTPMPEQERSKFLDELATRSHESLQEAIRQGMVGLFEPVATSTKMAIMWR